MSIAAPRELFLQLGDEFLAQFRVQPGTGFGGVPGLRVGHKSSRCSAGASWW